MFAKRAGYGETPRASDGASATPIRTTVVLKDPEALSEFFCKVLRHGQTGMERKT